MSAKGKKRRLPESKSIILGLTRLKKDIEYQLKEEGWPWSKDRSNLLDAIEVILQFLAQQEATTHES